MLGMVQVSLFMGLELFLCYCVKDGSVKYVILIDCLYVPGLMKSCSHGQN
jgi:hypothetical protein